MSDKKSVVIIGAGGAGIGVAQALDKKFNPSTHSITVLASREYYFHYPAALRAVVTAEGELENHIALPYDRAFGKDQKGGKGRSAVVRYGEVVSVEEQGEGGSVTLETGEHIKWDILVIATGNAWNGPLRWPAKKQDIQKYVDQWRERFATAKSVVLVGAGAVGSELAGEILEFYPGTQVSVVHSGETVLNPTYPMVFRKRIQSGLESRGAKVLVGDVLDISQETLDGSEGVVAGRTVSTKKGVKLAAELIIPTVGPRHPSTNFLATSTSAPTIAKALTSDGHLDVLATMQLKTNPHVFAIGDVVGLPEQHTLIKAGAHAPVAAANILNVLGLSSKALVNYTKAMDGILITNGRTRGSTYLDFFTFFGRPIIFGDWFSSLVKSKTLLVSLAKGSINAN